MTDVRVRSLRPDDAENYIELLRRIDRETKFLMWEPGERTIEGKALSEQIAARDETQRLQLVAENHDVLLGFLACHRGGVRRTQHRCDFTMAVLAGQQRRGIGRQLLLSMQAWAREKGLARVELTVMANNDAAISLYERIGFTVEGVKVGAIVVDGVAIDEVVMGMRLQTS
jgi:ribosomal protein S18 acetylase RimI-like enzyme